MKSLSNKVLQIGADELKSYHGWMYCKSTEEQGENNRLNPEKTLCRVEPVKENACTSVDLLGCFIIIALNIKEKIIIFIKDLL